MNKILINGFGRIGRTLFKILVDDDQFFNIEININDPFMSIEEMVYLLKYDSIYGRFDKYSITFEGNVILLSNNLKVKKCKVFHIDNLSNNDFYIEDCMLIDCSSVKNNISYYNEIEKKFDKILITRWVEGIPYFVDGLSENEENLFTEKSISMGICDVVGIGTVINRFQSYCIEEIDIVTMHPWLSYQNVLDGQPKDVIHTNSPNLQIGRESVNSIIPKESSLNGILKNIFRETCDKINVMTYRVPTDIVTCCDLRLTFKDKKFTIIEILELLKCEYIELCSDPMVSRDFVHSRMNSAIDINWIRINNNRLPSINHRK